VDAVSVDANEFNVKDDQRYATDILPEDDSQFERAVVLGRAARVDGFIYGKEITLHAGHSDSVGNFTSAAGLYGEVFVELEGYCMIATHVQCNGEIIIGEDCEIFGDVIGGVVTNIGDRTRIAGNVIADGNIVVGSDVWVGGYVVSLNGSIAINQHSKVFDIICNGDIELADDVTVMDRVIRSSNGRVLKPGSVKVGNNISSVDVMSELTVGDRVLSALSENEFNINELVFRGVSYSEEMEKLGEALSTLDHSME
jgi:predicted acyltransferase (DUF342 family)